MTFLDLILPRRCAGCDAPDTRWCHHCARTTTTLRSVERSSLTTPAYALAPYAGPARRLVLAYKDNRRELAPILGGGLADGLIRLAEQAPAWADDVWLIPAPSRAAAAAGRGGNHMLRAADHTARELARQGIPAHVAPALRVSGTRDSVGLTPSQRTANLRGAVSVIRRNTPPPGTPTILLDDVVTTGATAAACVRALGEADIPVVAILAFTDTV